MFTAQWFSLGRMRCSPLNAALCNFIRSLTLILPPDLRAIGYDSIPVIAKLNDIGYIHHEDHIQPVYPWSEVRDILEYISCVEYSKSRLLNLPTGKLLGSIHVTPARHDSASLVFFAQATLDNLAVWLNGVFDLGLKGNNVSFYKNQIKPKLNNEHNDFNMVLDDYADFIQKLNSYRMEWLHRVSGGAQIYSDKNPSDPAAEISIQVPIDPEIPSLVSDPKKYLKRIQKVRSKNGGKWLMPIDEFACYIHGNTKDLVIKLLDVTVTTKVA